MKIPVAKKIARQNINQLNNKPDTTPNRTLALLSYFFLEETQTLIYFCFQSCLFHLQEVANEFNTTKVQSTVLTMARLRPKDKNVLFSTKVYGPTGYQQWAARSQHSDQSKGKKH